MSRKEQVRFNQWVIWVVLVVLLLIPILLNFVLPIPRFTSVIGDEKDWLSFYGGYLGAVIAAGISFYVMYRTLKYYKKADEYRHEVEWLNDFRKVCAEYVGVFNVARLLSIINEMTVDTRKATEQCEAYSNEIAVEKAKMNLFVVNFQDDKLCTLSMKLKKYENQYDDAFTDISTVLFRVHHASKDNALESDILVEMLDYDGISEEMKNMIHEYAKSKQTISCTRLYSLLRRRTKELESLIDRVSGDFEQYILEKSEQIEMIIIE